MKVIVDTNRILAALLSYLRSKNLISDSDREKVLAREIAKYARQVQECANIPLDKN